MLSMILKVMVLPKACSSLKEPFTPWFTLLGFSLLSCHAFQASLWRGLISGDLMMNWLEYSFSGVAEHCPLAINMAVALSKPEHL